MPAEGAVVGIAAGATVGTGVGVLVGVVVGKYMIGICVDAHDVVRLLSTGIDTLNLAAKGVVRSEVWELLAEAQQRARTGSHEEEVNDNGETVLYVGLRHRAEDAVLQLDCLSVSASNLRSLADHAAREGGRVPETTIRPTSSASMCTPYSNLCASACATVDLPAPEAPETR